MRRIVIRDDIPEMEYGVFHLEFDDGRVLEERVYSDEQLFDLVKQLLRKMDCLVVEEAYDEGYEYARVLLQCASEDGRNAQGYYEGPALWDMFFDDLLDEAREELGA